MTMPSDPIAEVKFVVLSVVAVVIFGIIGYLAYTKQELKTQVAELQLENQQYKTANDDWQTKTESANAALAQFKKDALARETLAANALTEAKRQNDTYTATAKAIMASKPSGDDCTAAKSVLNSYFARPR